MCDINRRYSKLSVIKKRKTFPDSKIVVNKIYRIINMKFNVIKAKRFWKESEIYFIFKIRVIKMLHRAFS